uniref:Homoserine dehydrogenase n=1 Tax=uncultured bacterium A1Q1_fos_15 TaxID=1256548 RepID=L7W1F6_9BACT|nr:homoserine dehydrogenase [uncultured bacterium A1Q1_fos_15]
MSSKEPVGNNKNAAQKAGAPRVVRIGVLGCGNVGAALVQLIVDRQASIETRTGVRLEIAKIAVRSKARDRDVVIDPALLTTDAAEVVSDPSIDIVVEAIGGIEPARGLITSALRSGKPVVTANKELLANCGNELFAEADAAQVDLLFEAAVAAGIPLVRPLRESLLGEDIRRVMGIVNGTTNFILSQMSEQHMSYADALSEAQSLGYAERDPTADVEGYDAGAKAAIIASIAFGAQVVAGNVYHEGISQITPTEIDYAKRLGFVVKLLAICERFDDESIAVRVHPAMVPVEHPLASVRDSFNAVFVEGAAVGSLMFFGRGAGGFPTASAVLGDVLDAALNLGQVAHGSVGKLSPVVIRPIDDLQSAFYINVEVADQPGVLAAVANVFGTHKVSIRSMEQEGLGDDARIVFITHLASEADVQTTLHDLRQLDAVRRVVSVLRVVGAE